MALMAEAKAVMVLVAVVVLIGAADVAAQSADCTSEITSLFPCLSFVTSGDKQPSPACCTAFAKVVSTNASCLCPVLSGNSGYQINLTKALTLPTACKVTTPPLSTCNGAPAPAPSLPATGPVSNPGTAPPPATAGNSNAGVVFAPSMVAIVSVAALVLMKILS